MNPSNLTAFNITTSPANCGFATNGLAYCDLSLGDP